MIEGERMLKRKFIYVLLLAMLLVICLPGCTKVVETETVVVDATVVDVYYEAAWVQPVWTGKFFAYITHSARYEVTLQYEDYKTTVNNSDLYNKYKDNIGGQVKCNLVTTYYDDDTVKITLEWDGDTNE